MKKRRAMFIFPLIVLFFVIIATPNIKAATEKMDKVQSNSIKWQDDNSEYFLKDGDYQSHNSWMGKIQKDIKDDKLNLNKYITRNDFAKLLWEVYFKGQDSLKLTSTDDNPFKDVNGDDNFTKYILSVKDYIPYYKQKNGNYFRGSELLTRETAAAALIKISGTSDNGGKTISDFNISDEKEISDGLKSYIAQAIGNKLTDIKSYGNKKYFCPKHPVTIEELSSAIQCVYDSLYPDNNHSDYGNSLFNSANSGDFVCGSGNFVFFTSPYPNGGLYRENADGANVQKVLDGSVQCLNSDGDWIYFILNGAQICKIKNDGTMKKTIYTATTNSRADSIYGLLRIKDKLYCLDYNEDLNAPMGRGAKLITINLDGTDSKILTKDLVWQFTVFDGYIYYSNATDGYTLYRMKTDGTEASKASDSFKELKNVIAAHIYSTGKNIVISNEDSRDIDTLYVIDFKNNVLHKLDQTEQYVKGEVIGDSFYYCDSTDKVKGADKFIFCRKINSNKANKVVEDSVISMNIVGDWIYYEKEVPNPEYIDDDRTSNPYLYEMWRVKLNGTGKQKININNEDKKTVAECSLTKADKAYIIKKAGSSYNQLTFDLFDEDFGEKYGNTMKNLFNGGIAAEYKGYTYYGINDGTDKTGIYKIKNNSNDSGKAVKISNNIFKDGLNAINNYIYYVETTNDDVYGISVNDMSKRLIKPGIMDDIICNGHYIYYMCDSIIDNNDQCLCRIKDDGTDNVRLSDDKYIKILGVHDDWVYYLTGVKLSGGSVSGSLCRIKNNGESKEIIAASITNVSMGEDGLYYIDYGGDVIKTNFNGEDNNKIFNLSGNISYININNGWMYYVDYDTLKKIELDGTQQTELYKYKINSQGASQYPVNNVLKIKNIAVCGEWLYFEILNPQKSLSPVLWDPAYETCRIKLDGSSFQNLTN